MLPNYNSESPTCGVIVEKSDEGEKVCGSPGSQAVYMVDPETRSRVTAILIVCDRHDKALEDGEKLIFLSDNKEDHLIVAYEKEEGDTDVTEPDAAA